MESGTITITPNVDLSQVELTIEKVKHLVSLIKEAKSLAHDLASNTEGINVTITM